MKMMSQLERLRVKATSRVDVKVASIKRPSRMVKTIIDNPTTEERKSRRATYAGNATLMFARGNSLSSFLKKGRKRLILSPSRR